MTAHQFRSNFLMIMWGLILAVFDFEINGVSIVPDIVGYILIAVAASRLVPLLPEFQAAVIVSWILAPLSLTDYVRIRDAALSFLITVAVTALLFVLVWKLCEGVARRAREMSHPALADFAILTRNLYIVFLVAGLVLGLVGPEMGSAVLVILIPLLILLVVVLVMLCLMCARAGRQLAPGDGA